MLLNGEGVRIGEPPERVIDKGIPGAGLLVMILTGKYMDHLPLYRQKQIFTRENIHIASSTIEEWTKESLIKLEPLYEQLLFDYHPSRVSHAPRSILDSFKGYLQTDGYAVYDKYGKKRDITHLGLLGTCTP